MIEAELAGSFIDPRSLYDRFLARLTDQGAVVNFVGTARPATKEGLPVERLFLDHHPRLTQRSLTKIANDAGSRFDVTHITIVHRFGEVRPGEAIVFVAAASAHRRAAFEATDYMMDRLKTEAVFWKREDAVDGIRWVEPTGADRAERTRWSD